MYSIPKVWHLPKKHPPDLEDLSVELQLKTQTPLSEGGHKNHTSTYPGYDVITLPYFTRTAGPFPLRAD